MSQQISFQTAVLQDEQMADEQKQFWMGKSWEHLWKTLNHHALRVADLEQRVRELEAFLKLDRRAE